MRTPTTPKAPSAHLAVFSVGRGTKVVVKRVALPHGDFARVVWYQYGKRKTKDFADTAKGVELAKAFARKVFDKKTKGDAVAVSTVGDLWEAYAKATFPALRPKTRGNYTEQWAYFQRFVGERFSADRVNQETLDQLVYALRVSRKDTISVRVTQDVLSCVRRVYAWGYGRELIGVNRVAGYRLRVAKEERTPRREEYTPEEADQLLAALDPTTTGQWRPFVVLSICRHQGVRQWAALHLQWDDIDPATNTITWRAAWDKLGKEWSQPMSDATTAALDVAMQRRVLRDDHAPWVVPAGRKDASSEVYGRAALHAALRAAEGRAGITPKVGRGAHGLRKTKAADLRGVTKDPLLALQAIGDTDPRMVATYLQPRDVEIRDAFAALDKQRGARAATKANGKVTSNENGAPDEDAPLTVDKTITYEP